MLKFLKDRCRDYDANIFLNELIDASKYLGILEAKIEGYQFDRILVPLLHKKEALSSMYIEGTQTTISKAFENEVKEPPRNDVVAIELRNHTNSILFGSEYLRANRFSHSFIQQIHKMMMDGIVSPEKSKMVGRYKTENNHISNGAKKIVFLPPPYTETKRYMDELISYMNEQNDSENPLIKAAIIHAQFESIHPFGDGNGRVGRLLISLYLYKAGVINFPFFYMSEAISMDKGVYYNMLTSTREGSYSEWIRFFLKKCVTQAKSHIRYIDALNRLYEKTKHCLKTTISTPKYEQIMECLFTQPVLNANYLADRLGVSSAQARRYLESLEAERVLHGDDKKRGRTYYFEDLLDLAGRL